MEDNHKEIKKILEHIPDTFDVLKEGIDIQIQKEYLDYSHSFEHGELTDNETLQLSSILFSPETSLTGKKKALTILAHIGTITAFRQIEKYCKNPDKDLRQWAALALRESRMLLESTLTDRNFGFISSGLGGLKNKLRYYFLVLPVKDRPFTLTQKNIIKNEINFVAKDLNCVVEVVDKNDNFVGLTVLVPMDLAVGTFIETGIKKCNELGDFVYEYYYVTNMEVPDKAEIEEIIKKVKG